MSARTGGQILVDQLVAQGVEHVTCVPGESYLAVLDALQEGQIEGAVTDVTVPEPPPPEHRIWSTPGMVVTPHVSSDDRARYNDRTLDILMENLRALRDNRPLPNRVDPAKGY